MNLYKIPSKIDDAIFNVQTKGVDLYDRISNAILDRVRSKDHFKFQIFNRTDLAEDIFIKDSDRALKKVNNNGISNNIYRAMLYTDNVIVEEQVREYLRRNIDGWQKIYQHHSNWEYKFKEESDLQRSSGNDIIADVFEHFANSRADYNDESSDHIRAQAYLSITLDEEGLEMFVEEAASLYPDEITYSPNKFSNSSTDS